MQTEGSLFREGKDGASDLVCVIRLQKDFPCCTLTQSTLLPAVPSEGPPPFRNAEHSASLCMEMTTKEASKGS